MSEIFDISRFDSYREDNRREVKKAHDGLPVSLWDTYSAIGLEIFNADSVRGYRNTFASLKDGHPFVRLGDNEFLRSIGAAAISNKDNVLHPTAAGLLMFGNEYDIVRQFPNYFFRITALSLIPLSVGRIAFFPAPAIGREIFSISISVSTTS